MLFDTSAWIEFFQGTEKGKIVAKELKKGENFTSVVTLAELSEWCLRNKLEQKMKEYSESLKNNSQVLDLNETIVVAAGKLNYHRKKSGKKWGMMDSLIVATAQSYGLAIITKDRSFSDLPDVLIL